MNTKQKFSVGDLVEVTRKDGKKFTCIIVENYDVSFVGKVLSKDRGIGCSSWKRFNLKEDGRFQSVEDCKEIKVLSETTKETSSYSLKLNESVSQNGMTYYTTKINEKDSLTLCLCEGYGGWSRVTSDVLTTSAFKESFLNSQIAKLSAM